MSERIVSFDNLKLPFYGPNGDSVIDNVSATLRCIYSPYCMALFFFRKLREHVIPSTSLKLNWIRSNKQTEFKVSRECDYLCSASIDLTLASFPAVHTAPLCFKATTHWTVSSAKVNNSKISIPNFHARRMEALDEVCQCKLYHTGHLTS